MQILQQRYIDTSERYKFFKKSRDFRGKIRVLDITIREFVRVSISEYEKEKNIRYFHPSTRIAKDFALCNAKVW